MSEHIVYDTILARRSIRNFLETKIEHDKIELMLQAAMAAPSACNLQPWAFIVVDEPETLNQLKDATEQGLASVCIGGFDENAVKQVLTIPEEVTPLCILEIGYPAYQRDPRTWYTEEAVYWQKFDKNRKRTMRTLQMLQEDAAAGII